jgi:outer membrane protein assembly factor BamB
MSKINRALCLTAVIALLGACSTPSWLGGGDDAPPLEGERVSILELQRNLEPDSDALAAQGFVAPTIWRNEFWPQAGGYANHSMQHIELGENLKQAWSVKIGDGASDSLPLTAQPIVVDGKIFTMDTDSIVSAFDITNGKKIWKIDVRDKNEDDAVIGGGLAYSGGTLYITNGYNEIIAVSPADGTLAWRAKISAPSRAAPTVHQGRVFVTTLHNKLVALDATSGDVLWEYAGLNETAGLIGAASPATGRDIVVPAFSSGEIVALRVENGALAWSENLSSRNPLSGLSNISDIRALPVVDKGLVIAISFGGRMIAVEERTGSRIWQRDIGGSETPWLAGNHLFVLSNDNELIALGRDNGVIRWVTQLPRFDDPEDRDGKLYWTGPVLAGNRLIVAGTRGRILEFSPETGDMINEWSVKRSISVPPVVAGGVLYLLADDGTLMAYR